EYTGGAENIPESMGKNRIYFCRIRVKNTGIVTWERGGSEPFYMSYHWLDFETKKTEVFDGERTLLPVDRIEPGQETEMDLKILAPQEPGSYILQVDMVHEGKTWFSYQGVPALEKYVSVNVDYAASYSDDGTTPNQVQPGEKFTTYITVTNNGFLNWENKGPQRVDLGVHWYNRDTREVEIFDADSGELPGNVGHGESAQVAMQITAPQKPGRYVLAYDLVHEQVTWFSHQGVFPLEIDVNVGMTLDNSIVKKTSVMVYNGCGIKGAATEFSDYLKSFNFKVYGMANAKNYDFEKTYVIYKSGKEKNAEQLGLILSNYVLEKYSTKWADYYSKADMIVILGRDYKSNIEKP
ncbi:MAG: hypothetical protein FJW66_07250, partial [Actinobacteria bacterium]|nr:hypothetical protein [Actinomycetota bacterium]